MTGIAALAGDLGAGMIDERRCENAGVVAVAAIAADRDMTDRPGSRAQQGITAVVAGDAIACNTPVIENGRLKRHGGMAQVTILLRRQVNQRATLADRKIVVMTVFAIAGNALVRKGRRQETVADDMAGAAIVRRRDMPRRLADSAAGIVVAVVARGAIIGDTAMRENRWRECRGDMTVRAIPRHRDMRQGLADADHVVVAVDTTTRDAGMIVNPAGKASRCMTQPAVRDCRHVIQGFTERRNAVAGIAALTENFRTGMIDERRNEGGEAMTIPAVAADRDMVDRFGGCS